MMATELLAWAGAIGAEGAVFVGIPGALFAIKEWRKEPFVLTPEKIGIAHLVRIQKKPMQIKGTFVFGHSPVHPTYNVGTSQKRVLRRNQRLVLDVRSIPAGDVVTVHYRKLGRRDVELDKKITESRELRVKRNAQRYRLADNHDAWEQSHGYIV
ncbi:hypothetical protein [Rhodococcus sp. NPDC055024]